MLIPETLKAKPADNYKDLKRQFLALKKLCESKIKQCSIYSNKIAEYDRESILARSEALESEKEMNAQLTEELAKANERVEHLEQCISVYHSGIVDMFPHPSVTDGTFFVPIEKYNSMVIKLAELSSKQEQVLANNHSSCELECGAYGTYCKCQDKQLRKEQEHV